MISDRIAVSVSLLATAVSFFTLGVVRESRSARDAVASSEARIQAIRDELRQKIETPAGTAGEIGGDGEKLSRAQLVEEIKEQLQAEMGLLPTQLLRDRQSSFVELYADDNFGKTNYGTAGYLGNGYFITVKHAVVALKDDDNRQGSRKVVEIRLVINGKEMPAKLVDAGNAEVEVDKGDWAIVKTAQPVDLPALTVDTTFAYGFADPLFRLGNDYSKGIVVSTGYVGQKTPAGLVTSLTDGHPGVSGGGVLDQRGDLVGIPVGRMQGDYRFSFILPMRPEMLRKVPGYQHAEGVVLATSIR